MTNAPPLLRDEAFLEEHRRIQQRLMRIQKFAGPSSGFPTTLSALVACVDEMSGLLPDLSEHFTKEERALRPISTSEAPAENRTCAEQIMGEHQPLIRELRALMDSGRQVIEDLRAGRDAASMAEALRAYLSACVKDLLDHEEKEKQLLS
jgi:iron-sulfur cluster repair protein YtfE (RIC family)